MITIKLKPNDSIERAMTKLKNIVIKEGLYKELKDRRYYAKPSLDFILIVIILCSCLSVFFKPYTSIVPYVKSFVKCPYALGVQ